jgi:hypothetical protein
MTDDGVTDRGDSRRITVSRRGWCHAPLAKEVSYVLRSTPAVLGVHVQLQVVRCVVAVYCTTP